MAFIRYIGRNDHRVTRNLIITKNLCAPRDGGRGYEPDNGLARTLATYG